MTVNVVTALDAGSSTIRVGTCENETFDFSVPAIVDRIDDKTCVPFDHTMLPNNLEYPIECGMVRDWDAFETLLRTMPPFKEDNKLECLLMTVKVRTPDSYVQQLTEFVFETLQVPFFHIAHQSVTDLYAGGVTSGTSIEFSDGAFTIATVEEGAYLLDARIDLHGSRHLSRIIMEQINKRNGRTLDLLNPQHVSYVDKIKLSCFVRYTTESPYQGHEEEPYVLPDGSTVMVEKSMFSGIGDLLFQGNGIGDVSFRGFTETIHDLFARLPHNAVCTENIALRGMPSLMPGFHERIKKEIRPIMKGREKRVLCGSFDAINHSTFIGMSILGSLETFKSKHMLNRAYYDEHGVSFRSY
jgi:actin-related protein